MRQVVFLALPVALLATLLFLPTGCGQKACENDGGQWTTLGTKKRICIAATTDFGQECTDSSECEGWCEPDPGQDTASPDPLTGTCSEYVDAGCIHELDDGRPISICY